MPKIRIKIRDQVTIETNKKQQRLRWTLNMYTKHQKKSKQTPTLADVLYK